MGTNNAEGEKGKVEERERNQYSFHVWSSPISQALLGRIYALCAGVAVQLGVYARCRHNRPLQ